MSKLNLFIFLSAFTTLFLTSAATASDPYGAFDSSPTIQPVSSDDPDWQYFKLIDTFSYIDKDDKKWTVPKGYDKLNGASIPRPFWTIIGSPLAGNYLHASIIHDYFCETKSETHKDTHRMFYFGMLANKVPKIKAKLMYLAVAAFGPKWEHSEEALLCISGIANCASIPPPISELESEHFENSDDYFDKGLELTWSALSNGIDNMSLDQIDNIASTLARQSVE